MRSPGPAGAAAGAAGCGVAPLATLAGSPLPGRLPAAAPRVIATGTVLAAATGTACSGGCAGEPRLGCWVGPVWAALPVAPAAGPLTAACALTDAAASATPAGCGGSAGADAGCRSAEEGGPRWAPVAGAASGGGMAAGAVTGRTGAG